MGGCNRLFRLYGQAIKRIRWMPWQLEAMKDVVACDKPRGGGKQPLLSEDFRMGEPTVMTVSYTEYIGV